jgi:metal-dependent amidase/aminoacylase/carboxypeptidase family protein
VASIEVRYTGKEAHASGFPELGVNAADALTIAQTAIGLLRQHIAPSARIHGIVTKGGDAPNIVPAHTAGCWYVRERTLADLAELEPRVHRCFEAGALATGCEMRIELQCPRYSEFTHDLELTALYRRNAVALGRDFAEPDEKLSRLAASTDMANVSLVLPTIHPMLGLDSFPVTNHQPEFAAYCVTPVADRAVRDGALGMAWTCIDLAGDEAMRDRLLARSA